MKLVPGASAEVGKITVKNTGSSDVHLDDLGYVRSDGVKGEVSVTEFGPCDCVCHKDMVFNGWNSIQCCPDCGSSLIGGIHD